MDAMGEAINVQTSLIKYHKLYFKHILLSYKTRQMDELCCDISR
jgi:hypothetical protein